MAGLILQVVWAKKFALALGSTESGVVAALAGFMAGLYAGSRLVETKVARLSRPFLVYAALEMAIALSALAVIPLLGVLDSLQLHFFGGQPELPPKAAGFREFAGIVAAGMLQFVPAGCMGATLPVLVRGFSDTSHSVEWLYGTNTLGAAVGSVLAAFVLIPGLGLQGAVFTAVGANIAASAFGLWLNWAQRCGSAPIPETASEGQEARLLSAPRPLVQPGALALCVLLSGAAAMISEVLWTRLLCHLLGSSAEAFGLMLAAFLSGIALGSFAVTFLPATMTRLLFLLAAIQVGAAVTSLIAYCVVPFAPNIASLLTSLGLGQKQGNSVVAALALLAATFCFGATFPTAVRFLGRMRGSIGQSVAHLYAWNTVGALSGVVLGGMVVLPMAGFSVAIKVVFVLNIAAAGTLIAATAAKHAHRLLGTLAILLANVIFVLPEIPNALVYASPFDPSGIQKPEPATIVFRKPGRTSSVLLFEQGNGFRLRTNGLPEAFIPRRGVFYSPGSETQWMANVGQTINPEARHLLVVGMGGGVVPAAVDNHIARIDVIEIEQGVVEANRAVSGLRDKDPLQDSRLRLVLNDARVAMRLTSRKWDVIVSQPSHPWTSASAHLYSKEFLSIVASCLAPKGVFVQWMAADFMTLDQLRSLAATVLSVFNDALLFKLGSTYLFVSSTSDLDVTKARPTANASHGLLYPEDLAAALIMDGAALRSFAGQAPLLVDDKNLLVGDPGGQSPSQVYDNFAAHFKTMSELRVTRGGLPLWNQWVKHLSIPLIYHRMTFVQGWSVAERFAEDLSKEDAASCRAAIALMREDHFRARVLLLPFRDSSNRTIRFLLHLAQSLGEVRAKTNREQALTSHPGMEWTSAEQLTQTAFALRAANNHTELARLASQIETHHATGVPLFAGLIALWYAEALLHSQVLFDAETSARRSLEWAQIAAANGAGILSVAKWQLLAGQRANDANAVVVAAKIIRQFVETETKKGKITPHHAATLRSLLRELDIPEPASKMSHADALSAIDSLVVQTEKALTVADGGVGPPFSRPGTSKNSPLFQPAQ